ncbi:helix-turn-helix transcriptional regulator [Gracilibacillus caseinilyticus]|uniref:Helix-turn-helix transcriptional regulator n=1 Tax=Gracilibacillus caseinilyticus TaxID=2932256 RepID=A0ABY4F0B2_9BACI|nr:helix-turn-helix transcriptional regulator [Gracilibacillus caseinilyticus]UOQ49617.1 helix-turn-helix transcriptional regulator [Gracilibacillus caseinilyticus]
MGKHKERNMVYGREISSKFAVAIREKRKQLGLSLEEVSEQSPSSPSPSYISRLERYERRNPTFSLMVDLANCLGMDLNSLFRLSINIEDKGEDVVDLFQNNSFSIEGEIVNSMEIRAKLMEIVRTIIYEMNVNVSYKDALNLLEKIREFHQEKEEMMKEGV